MQVPLRGDDGDRQLVGDLLVGVAEITRRRISISVSLSGIFSAIASPVQDLDMRTKPYAVPADKQIMILPRVVSPARVTVPIRPSITLPNTVNAKSQVVAYRKLGMRVGFGLGDWCQRLRQRARRESCA